MLLSNKSLNHVYRLLKNISSLIPLPLRIFFVRCLAVFFIPLPKKVPWMIELVQEKFSVKKRCTFHYQYWIARLERKIWKLSKPPSMNRYVRITGKSFFEQTLAQKKGIIFVSTHHLYLHPFFYWIKEQTPQLETTLMKAPHMSGKYSKFIEEMFMSMNLEYFPLI